MPYTPEQIEKLPEAHERIYQRAINALYGKAIIEVVIRIRGGGDAVRTTSYEVIASGPDVMAAVVITGPSERGVTNTLATEWAKARRFKDVDVFKREVVQRSGGAITAEVAQLWGEQLSAEKYFPAFKDLRAKFMHQAVAAHPGGRV